MFTVKRDRRARSGALAGERDRCSTGNPTLALCDLSHSQIPHVVLDPGASVDEHGVVASEGTGPAGWHALTTI